MVCSPGESEFRSHWGSSQQGRCWAPTCTTYHFIFRTLFFKIYLLGGDGSRSDLLVDQKGHLVRRILQGQHQLFSHQQCLKIEINRRFIFSSLINKAEINSSYLKRRGEDADNVNPAPPPRSILALIGNVRILSESGRQNLWGYRWSQQILKSYRKVANHRFSRQKCRDCVLSDKMMFFYHFYDKKVQTM